MLDKTSLKLSIQRQTGAILLCSIQTKMRGALTVPNATKLQVSVSMWTVRDRAISLSQTGQKNKAELLITAAPPAVCGNRITATKLSVYTQHFITVI